jgi:hypothetical protein
MWHHLLHIFLLHIHTLSPLGLSGSCTMYLSYTHAYLYPIYVMPRCRFGGARDHIQWDQVAASLSCGRWGGEACRSSLLLLAHGHIGREEMKYAGAEGLSLQANFIGGTSIVRTRHQMRRSEPHEGARRAAVECVRVRRAAVRLSSGHVLGCAGRRAHASYKSHRWGVRCMLPSCYQICIRAIFFYSEMQDAMYIWVVGLRRPLFSMVASSG